MYCDYKYDNDNRKKRKSGENMLPIVNNIRQIMAQ